MNDVKNDIATLRNQWDALLKLDVLAPAKLTDEDLEIVLAARNEAPNREVGARMPMIVAQFKKAAQKEIMKRARKKTPYAQSDKFGRRYAADIEKINKVLFGEDIWFMKGIRSGLSAEAYIGRFAEPITGELHSDGGRGFCYAARLGDLPIWYIRGQDSLNASKKTRGLMRHAQYPSGELAREELRERKILLPLPFGDVALMLNYENPYITGGTLHCSSPVPKRGAVSAFFRVDWTQLNLPVVALP